MIAVTIIEAIALLAFCALAIPFVGSYGTVASPTSPPISPSILFSVLLLVACLLPLAMELIFRKRQRKPSLVLGMVSSIIRSLLYIAAILAIFFYMMPGYAHLWGNFDFVFKFVAICVGLSLSIVSFISVLLPLKEMKKV